MTAGSAAEKVCPRCGRTYPADSVFCPADGSSLRLLSGGADLVGTVIADRYLVLDKLGEGGMGQVYRARHVRLPQEVAIKVLSPRLVDDPDSIARFNREAANASSISNEHVARVFDFGETGDGLVYLAMEFVPGRTLRALTDADGALDPLRAASLVWQIADGLDAAHRRGIVHRDLKPENVLVFEEADGTESLKVVDFGIAKALDGGGGGGAGGARVTRTGLVIGTPEFMSPEQITGDEVDARSDVYALALVAAVLLTGRPAFPATTPEQAMTARLLHDPRPLRELRPEVDWPEAVQAALDRGLARVPDDRPATAGEFAVELANAVQGWLTPEPGATGVGTRPTPIGRRGFPTPVRPSGVIAPPSAAFAAPVPPAGPTAAHAPAPAPAAPPLAPTTARAASGAASSGAVGAVDDLPRSFDVPAPGASAPSGRPRGLMIGGLVLALAVAAAAGVLATKGPTVPPAAQADTTGNAIAPPAGDALAGAPPAAPPPDAPIPAGRPETPAERVLDANPDVLDADAADRALDDLLGALHPDSATEVSARGALRTLDSLLPRLGTAADSVRADLLRVEALIHVDQIDRACGILRALRGRSLTANQRARVDLFLQSPEVCG